MTKQFITLLSILSSSIAYSQVGINTPDPKASLDIQSKGNTAITKALRINNSDDTEMMTVTDQGRMGIGTTNPEGELHVRTTTENGIISERSLSANNSIGGYISLRRNKSDNPNINGAVVMNDYLGAITFSGNTGNGYEGSSINSNSSIISKASQNYSTNAQGSELIFRTVPNGTAAAANRMTIANNGNVGIGTTSPSTKLHVQGSVRIADGTQGENKVLTSDANGNASWSSTPATYLYFLSSSDYDGFTDFNGIINPNTGAVGGGTYRYLGKSTIYNLGPSTPISSGADGLSYTIPTTGVYRMTLYLDRVPTSIRLVIKAYRNGSEINSNIDIGNGSAAAMINIWSLQAGDLVVPFVYGAAIAANQLNETTFTVERVN